LTLFQGSSQALSHRKTTWLQAFSVVGWHRADCAKCKPPIGLPETISCIVLKGPHIS